MDQGIIIRSLLSILLTLKKYYENSFSARIVRAISSFAGNMADGSKIIGYFRKCELPGSLWEASLSKKWFDAVLAYLKNVGENAGNILNQLLEGSFIIAFFMKATRSLEISSMNLENIVESSIFCRFFRYLFTYTSRA